jgi:hypothetical protein
MIHIYFVRFSSCFFTFFVSVLYTSGLRGLKKSEVDKKKRVDLVRVKERAVSVFLNPLSPASAVQGVLARMSGTRFHVPGTWCLGLDRVVGEG